MSFPKSSKLPDFQALSPETIKYIHKFYKAQNLIDINFQYDFKKPCPESNAFCNPSVLCEIMLCSFSYNGLQFTLYRKRVV